MAPELSCLLAGRRTETGSRPSVALASVLALLAALSATTAGADEFRVPLTVEESAGVARRAEPISGGVPLPKGRFPRDQAFALAAADGREVPCQTSPLVVETDGTLR